MKKTPIDEPIGTQDIFWIKKDGNKVLITAKIGRPYQVDESTWACPAELIGVDNKYPDIHGSGSMQSLSLAIGLIKMRLGHLLEDGEALYFLENSEVIQSPENEKSKWDINTLNAIFGK